jgi:hypothetical protein
MLTVPKWLRRPKSPLLAKVLALMLTVPQLLLKRPPPSRAPLLAKVLVLMFMVTLEAAWAWLLKLVRSLHT